MKAHGLSQRSRQPELMDAGFGDAVCMPRCWPTWQRVNRLTLTHRPVLQFLAAILVPAAGGHRGVGAGRGLRPGRPAARHLATGPAAGTRAAPHGPGPATRQHTGRARRHAADDGHRFVTADLFAYRPRNVDYIVSSQLAHHLDDERIVEFMAWMQRHARRGWCIADLRRHWLPYLAFPWLARAARWHRIVRIDGTRSVARACTPQEWQQLIARAGVRARVRECLPFRLSIESLGAAAPQDPHAPA